MKYGEKLQQRSIPAWSAYNIDYDDVKGFIKARTTTSSKANATPIRSEDKVQQTEDDLFTILDEQHRRIDLFVKSKAREIQHRLDDAKRRLRHLAARQSPVDARLSAAKLEKYSRLENDVLKAGEEIKSLARFTGAQRTAFGKLLKKYKKWSGSVDLEDRFRDQVLNDPKSFTKYDLGPLLDEYSETLHNIRALYTSRLSPTTSDNNASYLIGSSIIGQLLSSVASQQKSAFDTAIATVPLGQGGKHATYFVHPDNVVELQVLLMQHLNFHISRSRQNSQATPITTKGSNEQPQVASAEAPSDYFWLGADDVERFAQEQSTLNLLDCEARTGSTPQRTKISARWSEGDDDDALIAARVGETHVQVSKLKKKHVESFFMKQSLFPARRASISLNQQLDELTAIRKPYASDSSSRPLFMMSSHRTRFLGIHNTSEHVSLATLDTGIMLGQWEGQIHSHKRIKFPYAILIIREEGPVTAHDAVIELLDHSHLVERVQGFSMECQAIWQLHEPDTLTKPYWTSMLTHDIRKLPPPALKHADTTTSSNTLLGSSSGLESSTGTASVLGTQTDSTTAVETSVVASSDLEVPPLRAFRKKRRRAFPQQPIQPAERYWSEYDHPEDGEQNDAYVIYLDPDEKSTFDRMVETVSAWFSPRKPAEDEERLISSPVTPKDDESSSEDEAHTTARARRNTDYGTVPRRKSVVSQRSQASVPFLPQPTITCLAASAVILVVGYVLAITGRHKQGAEVEAGVLFAFASSVLFIIAGVVLLARAKSVQQLGVAAAVSTVLAESVAAGGLLAHTIG